MIIVSSPVWEHRHTGQSLLSFLDGNDHQVVMSRYWTDEVREGKALIEERTGPVADLIREYCWFWTKLAEPEMIVSLAKGALSCWYLEDLLLDDC